MSVGVRERKTLGFIGIENGNVEGIKDMMEIDQVIKQKIEEVETANTGGANATRYGITIGIHSPARTGKSLTAVMLAVWYATRLKDIKGIQFKAAKKT